MDRSKIKLLKREDQELIAIMDWARLTPIPGKFLFHIENEGKKSYAAGNLSKRKGKKKGVSDLFLPYPMYPYHGLWIELKRKEPGKRIRATKEQAQWLFDMSELGYAVKLAHGAEDAINTIQSYLALDNSLKRDVKSEIKS